MAPSRPFAGARPLEWTLRGREGKMNGGVSLRMPRIEPTDRPPSADDPRGRGCGESTAP